MLGSRVAGSAVQGIGYVINQIRSRTSSHLFSATYNLGPLNASDNYIPPTKDKPLDCECNTVMYSLFQACIACQNNTNVETWAYWDANCKQVFVTQYVLSQWPLNLILIKASDIPQVCFPKYLRPTPNLILSYPTYDQGSCLGISERHREPIINICKAILVLTLYLDQGYMECF